MNPGTVLIIADDPQFSRDLASRWQSERNVPSFTLIESSALIASPGQIYDLAIVGSVSRERLAPVLVAALRAASSVLCVPIPEMSVQQLRAEHPRISFINCSEDSLEVLVLLGSETVRRIQAICRCRLAEQAAQASRREAVLGRYMLDTRHAVSNALTSILGNAELLLDEKKVTGRVREQIQTIHTMAINLRENMQRFSSLDLEMQSAGASQPETHSTWELAHASD